LVRRSAAGRIIWTLVSQPFGLPAANFSSSLDTEARLERASSSNVDGKRELWSAQARAALIIAATRRTLAAWEDGDDLRWSEEVRSVFRQWSPT
jgi:hypothetical protein